MELQNSEPPPTPLDYRAPARPPVRRWYAISTTNLALGSLMITGLLVLMLAPFSFSSHHHGESQRVHCAANLKQIGLAMIMYANSHQDQFPASLQEVFSESEMDAVTFVCPTSADTPAQGPTTQATAAALGQPGHCSYIYLGKGLTAPQASNDSHIVLAYEPLSTHRGPLGSGMNVLFGDGQVEFIPAPGVLPWIGKWSDGVVRAPYANGFAPKLITQPSAPAKVSAPAQ